MKALNIYAILFCSSIICSCDFLNGSCQNEAQLFRQVECLQVFEKLPVFSDPYLKSEGKHLLTGERCTCEDQTRSLFSYKKLLEKGDTIIKRRGELSFSIHKVDTIINIDWECEGKIYK